MVHAGTRNMATKDEGNISADVLELLLDASRTGDYSELADELMDSFWLSVEQGFVPQMEYTILFHKIVEDYPSALPALEKSFVEMNPFRSILPERPVPPAPAPASYVPDNPSDPR